MIAFLAAQVEKLQKQGAAQVQALQAAEAAAAQMKASQAEVESLREQSNSQLQALQAAESAEQELLAAQAEVRIVGLFRVQSQEKHASSPELFEWFVQRLADILLRP